MTRFMTSLRALLGAIVVFVALPIGFAPAAHAATVPSQGSATQFDVGNWNVEWFGDTGLGLADD